MQGCNGTQERLRELAARLVTETEHDKFTALVKELNELLDEQYQANQPNYTDTNS
jgi:hypothetical protein